MSAVVVCVLLVFGWITSLAIAYGAPSLPADAAPVQKTTPKNESAPRLVREANRLLLSDKPTEALSEYQKAESIKPDAREIAFGEGLAHYKLDEYDKARDAFNRAAGGAGDGLADDALYSLGTCDHAEALAAKDPKAALGKLESAMRSYQGVLADRPEHLAAKDANLKAASYWRQLKQQMQQQQQQQKDSDQNKDKKENEQKQEQQQQQDQKQNEQEQQQQEQAKQDDKQQKDQQQQQSADKDEQKQSEQAEQQKAEQEDVSREQAERKLREMMQALRDRKKLRREEVKSPPYRPTEKDW